MSSSSRSASPVNYLGRQTLAACEQGKDCSNANTEGDATTPRRGTEKGWLEEAALAPFDLTMQVDVKGWLEDMTLEEKVTELVKENNSLRNRLEQMTDMQACQVTRLQAQLKDFERRAEEGMHFKRNYHFIQAQSQLLQERIFGLEKDLHQSQQREEDFEEGNMHAQSQVRTLQQRVSTLESDLTESRQRVMDFEPTFIQAERNKHEVARLTEELEILEKKAHAHSHLLQERVWSLENDLQEKQHRVIDYEASLLKAAHHAGDQLLSRQREAEEREKALLHERAALQTQLEELQAQVEEANTQVAMTVKSGHEQALALEQAQKECNALRQECQRLSAYCKNHAYGEICMPKEKSATQTPSPPQRRLVPLPHLRSLPQLLHRSDRCKMCDRQQRVRRSRMIIRRWQEV